jgi:hypothetical protein
MKRADDLFDLFALVALFELVILIPGVLLAAFLGFCSVPR